MHLEQNLKFIDFTSKIHKIIYSPIYLIALVIIGFLGFSLRLEIYSLGILLLIMSFNLVFSRDVLPNFICFLMISLIPLQRYGEVNYYFPLAPLLIIFIPASIFHMVVYRVNFRLGKFFIPYLLITLAVTFGGLFSISLRDYFSMPGIYYVFMLGIGMIFCYLVLENYIPRNDHNIVIYFSKIMVAVCCMGILMIVYHYFHYMKADYYTILTELQWGNNLSNTLLMAIPFAFYLACREKKHNLFYFIIGISTYIALLMSLSRGGILFGTFIIPFCVIASLYFNKKDRKKFIFVIICLFLIFSVFLLFYFSPLYHYLQNLLHLSTDEPRFGLYKLGWQNFLNSPLFGTGLSFKGNEFYHPQPMCIYWYHSTIFQIIGSLGFFGVICYGYQYYFRTKVLFNVKSMFNIFGLIAFVGFEGYSLINVGDFAPLPFVLILTEIFVIIDRSNEILKKDNLLLSIEEYPLKKKIIH